MRLLPGEMCFMAVGLPHAEVGRPWRGPFSNVVIIFAPMSISWHVARADADGSLVRDSFRVVQTAEATRVAGYLADLVEAYHSPAPAHKSAVRGLAMTILAATRALMEGAAPARIRETYKVTQCRHYVLEHIGDPSLNVKKIAARIECSAGYLSNLFHQETEMTLISYIQRQRISQAKSLLDSSSFNRGEVGRAVGYEDHGYFCRVFRRCRTDCRENRGKHARLDNIYKMTARFFPTTFSVLTHSLLMEGG